MKQQYNNKKTTIKQQNNYSITRILEQLYNKHRTIKIFKKYHSRRRFAVGGAKGHLALERSSSLGKSKTPNRTGLVTSTYITI